MQFLFVALNLPDQDRILLAQLMYLALQTLRLNKVLTLLLHLTSFSLKHPPLQICDLRVAQLQFTRIGARMSRIPTILIVLHLLEQGGIHLGESQVFGHEYVHLHF